MICPRCKRRPLVKAGRTPSGKQRWVCSTQEGGKGQHVYCYSTTNPKAPVIGQNRYPVGAPAVFKRSLRKNTQRYIITAAQNATPVEPVFWKCLLNAAKHLNAELLVIPIRYRNPTSRWTKQHETDDWWALEVLPYLWNVRKVINANLVLLGDIKTQPTAVDPLAGFDSISGASSAILGHTKLHLKCIPTPSNRLPKIVTTTGACTVQNYSDTKAGKLGEFHHSLAAAVVEVSGKKFHLRQISYDKASQSFTDIDTRYGHRVISRAPRPLALVMGDTHVDYVAPEVEAATWGPAGIVAAIQPRHLIWHDLFDGYSVNPHHKGNPFNAIAKWNSGLSNVREEVKRAMTYLDAKTSFAQSISKGDCKSIIVASNHDDFLRRWVIGHDWKTDPENALFYLDTAKAMVMQTVMEKGSGTWYPGPFAYWIGQFFPNGCKEGYMKVLGSDESFALANVELGMHGDRGPNGARGSARNLRRIGIRSIIGHSHTPAIEEGCYQVGTSTNLRLEYNSGPSSWLNTHCILHADGKRQLINIIDGEWKLR